VGGIEWFGWIGVLDYLWPAPAWNAGGGVVGPELEPGTGILTLFIIAESFQSSF
jgi:hypothetical protein